MFTEAICVANHTIYPCVEKKVGQVIHQSINGFGLIYAERPSKQFFSHIGTDPPLPWYYQYFGGGGGGGG